MKILYVTADYEIIQPALMNAFGSLGHLPKLFYYEIQNKIPLKTYPSNVFLGKSVAKAHGPFLYLYKLNMAYKQCLRIAQKDMPDVIHGNMAFCDGYVARKISSKLNIPYVISVRSTDVYNPFLWKIPYLKRMVLKNLEYAKNIVFLSESTKRAFLKKLQVVNNNIEKKSVVIPNGIDDYYLERSFMRDKRNNDSRFDVTLISVGKIKKVKNFETTIDACRCLIEEGYSVKLTIVGKMIDASYIDLFNKYPFIDYVGEKSKELLIDYYKNSDVFVLPSHKETFGLVYAEAMSQGLPVIYTRGQGFDGQFEDGKVGFSVDDNNSEEIARKIKCILKNYDDIAYNCTINARQFNWTIIASRMVNECYMQ